MTAESYLIEASTPPLLTLMRLAPKMADVVIWFLDGPLADNSMRVTKPLGAEFKGLRSGYVGISYRVLVRIDDQAKVVRVMRIADRSDIYRGACPTVAQVVSATFSRRASH